MSMKHAATRRGARAAIARSPGGPLVSRNGLGPLIAREEKKKKDEDEEERGVGGAVSELLG